MTTDNNRPVRRTRDRAKLFGLLFILFVLAGIVLTRPLWEFMLPGAATPMPPTEVAIVTPTAARVEDAAATDSATAEPLALATFIDNAALEGSAEGELLLLFGGAEPDCPIIVAIDGNELGQTQSGSDGRWALRVPSPVPGDYTLQAICQRDGEQLASPEIPFVIPAADASGADASGADASGADASGADASGADAGATPDVDASGVLTETLDSSEEPTDIPPDQTDGGAEAGDETGEAGEGGDTDTGDADSGDADTGNGDGDAGGDAAAGGETPAPAAPTFTIANDLTAYVGGPLRVIGTGTPGATVDVSVTTADGSVADQAAATVNADGAWGTYIVLPPVAGDYQLGAASDGASAAPVGITIAGDVAFGGPGLCRGRTPPLGGFDRAALIYSVADCEYFSLIANRLGVSFAELQAANPQIANVNNIQPGTPLNVPPLP